MPEPYRKRHPWQSCHVASMYISIQTTTQERTSCEVTTQLLGTCSEKGVIQLGTMKTNPFATCPCILGHACTAHHNSANQSSYKQQPEEAW
eukprot:1159080-Pelagomonas_calceolata.AAC.7